METIRVVHDREGQSLTVWFADPEREAVSSEDEHGVIVMKDEAGQVIGIEVMGYTGQPGAVAFERAQAKN